jgi:hypothetical protein
LHIPLAQKFLLDKQISYEEIYFKSFQAIIHDTPVFFRPLILRHWINVSSDLWKDGLGNKMLDICNNVVVQQTSTDPYNPLRKARKLK